ncbi:hypothetical protein ASE04_26980 [Rhizobium sp. Root708]|nr:hypothetical protein ASE04_26980 [Rhizobium sp. Root708]
MDLDVGGLELGHWFFLPEKINPVAKLWFRAAAPKVHIWGRENSQNRASALNKPSDPLRSGSRPRRETHGCWWRDPRILQHGQCRSGSANLVVWPSLFEKRRRLVLGSSMMAVNGKIQREGDFVHLVTQQLCDLS